MSEDFSDRQRYLDPGIRKFWPNFVVSAVLMPLMWLLLIGLTLPDAVVSFYMVAIAAVPLSFALVLLPGWRLFRKESNAAVRLATAVLMVPALGVFLWGIYCTLLLVYLALTGDF